MSISEAVEDILKRYDFASLMRMHAAVCKSGLPLVILHDTHVSGSMTDLPLHQDFLSLYIVRQGRGTHIIDGVPFAISRGDVYIMGMGSMHRFVDCRNLLTDTLHFPPSFFDWETQQALTLTPGFRALFVRSHVPSGNPDAAPGEPGLAVERDDSPESITPAAGFDDPPGSAVPNAELGDCVSGRWLHLSPDALSRIQQSVDELRRESACTTPDAVLMIRAMFVRLLVELSRLYAADSAPLPPMTTARPHEATVAVAVRYMDSHFHEALRIDELAASVSLSADRFTEVFASIMGRTPKEYIRHLRIERAKTLLGTTEDTIAAVGLESGIGDAAYFTKVFRAATGLTPSEYRRRTVENRLF